jgi:hypothetical protein
VRVYIAGPYTKGDVAVNVRNALQAAQQVAEAGHAPFIPHLYHFWHFLFPGPYEQWTRLDFVWLPACQALIRLPGESSGSDAEVARAGDLDIPVFYGIDAFLDFAEYMEKETP